MITWLMSLCIPSLIYLLFTSPSPFCGYCHLPLLKLHIWFFLLTIGSSKCLWSGALPGKMLLVRIIKNKEINAYFRSVYIKKMLALPRRVRKGIRIGPCRVRAPPQGLEIGRKKSYQHIFNKPRSSILTGSAPDQIFLFQYLTI